MCGRAKLPNDYSEIKIRLRFDDRFPAPNFKASWNIAPTDPMLTAVRDRETGTRRPVLMRWGLIPWWSKDMKLQFSTFNAKAETVSTTPAFRDAWKDGRRCLVVTDGFYEWRKPDKPPFAIACVEWRAHCHGRTMGPLEIATRREDQLLHRHHHASE